MSMCPYCGRDAAIDEELGECRFCGGPRFNHEKEIEKATTKTSFPIAMEILQEQKEQFREQKQKEEEDYKKAIESDVIAKIGVVEEHKQVKKRYRKRKNKNPSFAVTSMVLVIVLGLLLLTSNGNWVALDLDGSAWITFHGTDELTGKPLNGVSMEIFSLDEGRLSLSETCIFSEGVADSIDDYRNGERLVLHIMGLDGFCDVVLDAPLQLSSEEIRKSEKSISINTLKIATDFDFYMTDILGNNVDSNYTHDIRNPFVFTTFGINTIVNTGYISTIHPDGRNWQAYMFIEINQIITPTIGYYVFISVSSDISMAVFKIPDSELTNDLEDGDSMGDFNTMFGVHFDTKGNVTIKYSLILNGDINQFMDVQVWNYGARIYENTVTFQVI